MPLYDYECKKCGKKFEEYSMVDARNSTKCKCGGDTNLLVSMPAISIFKPMWYHDISEEPIYVESKRQLRDECKKHNVIAARLL